MSAPEDFSDRVLAPCNCSEVEAVVVHQALCSTALGVSATVQFALTTQKEASFESLSSSLADALQIILLVPAPEFKQHLKPGRFLPLGASLEGDYSSIELDGQVTLEAS